MTSTWASCTKHRRRRSFSITHARTSGVAASAEVPSLSRVLVSRLHGYPLSLVCHTLGAPEMTLSTAHAAFSPPPSVPRQFRFHSRYAYPFLRAPSGAHRAELRACPSDPFPLEVPGPVSSRIPLDRMRFVKPARGLPSCSAFCRVTPVTPSPILGGEPALARLAAAQRVTVPADACG